MAGLLPLRLLSQPDAPDAHGPSRLSRSSSTRRFSLAINNLNTLEHTSTGTRIIAPVMTHVTRPRDKKEWKLALDIARELYAAGQYQDCTVYCINALELTRGLSHPLHVIYLSFYAATTTEKMAMEHSQSSQRKLELFLQACTYYRKALFYVPNASSTKKSPFQGIDFANLTHRSRSSLSTNNNYPELNSDGSSRSSDNDSVFSGIREYRDRTISPAPSTESEKVTDSLSSLRIGKRRHFQSKLPILVSEPDLNTYLQPAVVLEDVETSPALDSARASVQCRIASLNQASASCTALLNRSHTKRSSSLRSSLSPINLMGESNRQSVSDFMKQRSITRYEDQLSNCEKQIKRHLQHVEAIVQNLSQPPMKADENSTIRETSTCSLSAPLTTDSTRADSKMSYRSHADQEQNMKLPPIGYRSPSHFLPLPDTNPFRRNTDSLYNNIITSRGSHFGSSIGSSINFFDESKACDPEYDDEDMDRRGFESIEAILESSWTDESWPASPPSIQKLDIAKGRSRVLREVGSSHGNRGATAQHSDGYHSPSSRIIFKSDLSRCTSPDGTFGSCPLLQAEDRDTCHLMDDTTSSYTTQETGNEDSSLVRNADHVDGDSWF